MLDLVYVKFAKGGTLKKIADETQTRPIRRNRDAVRKRKYPTREIRTYLQAQRHGLSAKPAWNRRQSV